jgi:hypothetical protein
VKKHQLLLIATALVMAAQANAALYNIGFTASNNEILANGVVDVDVTGLATSGYITIYKGGSSLPIGTTYNLVPAGPVVSLLGSFQYDNMVNAATRPFIDNKGLLFSGGGREVSLFWNLGTDANNNIYSLRGFSSGTYAPNVTGGASISLAAVPEPSTYFAGMSAIGMLCLFGKRSVK